MTGLAVATVASPIVISGEDPAPSQEMLKRLKEIDPFLALRFYRFNQSFGVILHWHPNDPRWELVQKSEISEHATFDLLCFVPGDLSAEDAMQYVFQIAKRPSESKSWKQLNEEVMRHNNEQARRNVAAKNEEAMNQAETVLANRVRPTVFMNDTEARTTRPSRWKER